MRIDEAVKILEPWFSDSTDMDYCQTQGFNKALSTLIDYAKQNIKSEQILTDEEREYLTAVIKPFRDKVECIYKMNEGYGYYIVMYCGVPANLPPHQVGMYKGMRPEVEYTLDELGL